MKTQVKRKFTKRREEPKASSREQRPTPITVSVKFPVMMETYDRKKFQQNGHMIPALRNTDARGNPSFGDERKCGPTVYVLYLPEANGLTWRDLGLGTTGSRSYPPDEPANILRVLSDSQDDAMRKFQEQLPEILQGLWSAQFARQSSIGNYERIVREHANMHNFLQSSEHSEGLNEIMNGLPIPTRRRKR